MASLVTEEQIINKLATHSGAIDGVKNAYGFAAIPNGLIRDQLPAIVFWPSGGSMARKAHYNRWTNEVEISGVLFVEPRMSKAGTLKYLENTVMPYAQKFRQKFQTASVYSDLLSLGCQVADLESYQYGSGGLLLFNDIEYIGFVFTWRFKFTA